MVSSAIGQHQSASAQAAAQNQAAINNYKYQLKVRERKWDQTRHVYGRKIQQFKETVDENQMAAARGYAAAQSVTSTISSQKLLLIKRDD